MVYQLVLTGLDENFKSTYNNELQSLMDKAPSDASVCSKIAKNKNAYVGTLNVFSEQGTFEAKAVDKNPDHLAFNLLDQVYKQIKNWKRHRAFPAEM
jgi:hypothetical protein